MISDLRPFSNASRCGQTAQVIAPKGAVSGKADRPHQTWHMGTGDQDIRDLRRRPDRVRFDATPSSLHAAHTEKQIQRKNFIVDQWPAGVLQELQTQGGRSVPVRGPAIPKAAKERTSNLIECDVTDVVIKIARYAAVLLPGAVREPEKVRTGEIIVEQVPNPLVGMVCQKRLHLDAPFRPSERPRN